MPNRIIKESIRTSKSVNALTDFEFRVWLYLITYVDDYGRGSADAELLKGIVFTRRKGITETQIQKVLVDLANKGMIQIYEKDEEPYFCFPNWDKHQSVRAKVSKYPAPDNNMNAIEIIGNQLITDAPENPIQSESESNANANTARKRATRTKFVKPTVEEVAAYCAERKNGIDPQYFVDYYERNGWVVGKNTPMKDFKATIRTWERNDFNKNKQTKPETPASYDIERAEQRAKTTVPVLKKNERR